MYAVVRRTDYVPTVVRVFENEEQAREVMEKEFQECIDKHLGKDDEPDTCYLADRFAVFKNNGHCDNWEITMPSIHRNSITNFYKDNETSDMYAIIYATYASDDDFPEFTKVDIFEDEKQARTYLKKDCLEFIWKYVDEDVKVSINLNSAQLEYGSGWAKEYWALLVPIFCS